MKTHKIIELKIRVTEKGKMDNITYALPRDIPIARLANILSSSQSMLAKLFVDHCKKNGITEKLAIEELATSLTINDLSNEY